MQLYKPLWEEFYTALFWAELRRLGETVVRDKEQFWRLVGFSSFKRFEFGGVEFLHNSKDTAVSVDGVTNREVETFGVTCFSSFLLA